MKQLSVTLNNSLTRHMEAIEPPQANTPLGMYVCGPTVYAPPHIGNARSVVVYDVLCRLLRYCYGADGVRYVRNITDVDDKINAAAMERGITIQALTQEVTGLFHADMDALGCLRPDIEPRATEHIADIIAMIERLLSGGYAYSAQGHVLFDVTAPPPPEGGWHYGMLSGRTVEDQEAGARIAVEAYKRHPGDFVLWKPADAQDDPSSVFDSPWGAGRPGWHIECSAMSTRYLGTDFAIHGGGADLKFPHHENEMAQSCCAHPGSGYARLWVHNGFLTVDGEKMSKSLGNVVIVRDLLERGVPGEVIRFALLGTHYGKPLDWTEKLLADAAKQVAKLRRATEGAHAGGDVPEAFLQALCGDLNTPRAIALMHGMEGGELLACASLLGFDGWEVSTQQPSAAALPDGVSAEHIEAQIAARHAAKQAKDWAKADAIRDGLRALGIELEDVPGGVTQWKFAQ